MTFDAEMREAADTGGLLELNLRPFSDRQGRLAWKATAALASDQRTLIGIDMDPVSAIRKALRLEPNDLIVDETPQPAGGVFG